MGDSKTTPRPRISNATCCSRSISTRTGLPFCAAADATGRSKPSNTLRAFTLTLTYQSRKSLCDTALPPMFIRQNQETPWLGEAVRLWRNGSEHSDRDRRPDRWMRAVVEESKIFESKGLDPLD